MLPCARTVCVCSASLAHASGKHTLHKASRCTKLQASQCHPEESLITHASMPTVCTYHPCFHAHCVHVAALLSRMRLGGDNLTDADWALLESRVCSTKGHVEGCKKAAKVRCCKFEDTVKPARTKAGRKSRAAPKVTGRLYCAIATGATVIAALREKVNAINELHIEGQRQKNIRIYESQAVDTGPMGLPVINPHVLAAVDKQARSQLRTLSMYVGMSALLTINAVRLASSSTSHSSIMCLCTHTSRQLRPMPAPLPRRIWPPSS